MIKYNFFIIKFNFMEENKNLKPILESKELEYKGKFLSYFVHNYKIIPQNKKNPVLIQYEMVDYNSRCFSQNEMPNEFIGKNNYNIYAMNIIPLIYYSSQPKKIILVAVFRYPINKYCLEFPGGFIDKSDSEKSQDFSETVKKATLRELEEETGYKGVFMNYSAKYFINNEKSELNIESNLFFDPWKSGDNALECFVKINGDEIKNKKEQKLDENELIKVYEVDLDKLMEFIVDKINKDGYGCSSQLYNFALGINFNKIINKTNSE